MEPKSDTPAVAKKTTKRGNKKKPKRRLTYTSVFYAILVVVLSVFVFESVMYFKFTRGALRYWGVCVHERNHNGSLRTMNRVFDQLNYTSVDGTDGADWDVLWSIEFPFWKEAEDVFEPLLKPLKPHQRINHFPGMNYITKKEFMNSVNKDAPYILKSFEFPLMIEEFNEFVENHPEKKLVEKNVHEGGVKIVTLRKVNFDTTEKFYQEFMGNPLLIDGRAFDIGVFVLLSSIEPLRIYRFDNEIELRFCNKPYHPFNERAVDKYVVNEKHTHFFEMPSMKKSFENDRTSYKRAFEYHLKSKGNDAAKILQENIDFAIVDLFLRNEMNLIAETAELYNSTRNFFELVRFDFIVDETLNTFLIEVNNSPNLTPILDRYDEAAANEKLVFDTIRLVGAENRLELMSSYELPSDEIQSTLNPKFCLKNNCEENCQKTECKICSPCASDESLRNLYQAYKEHNRRGGFKRLYPSTMDFQEDFIASLTPSNQVVSKWFKEKCNENEEWC